MAQDPSTSKVSLELHNDTAGSFISALMPHHECEEDTTFQKLDILGTRYLTLAIAVPPRVPTPVSPLDGARFAVKDNIRLRGLKTSLCNSAYLSISQPSDKTAPIIRSLITAGAYVVGMTKLSSMIGKEEPTEAIDFPAPFNPRGDGYQSPAGSSSGSASAIAAYDWLDFAIGTDTTGSGRRPALVNGVFQMRPTHDTRLLEGVVPCYKAWDVPVVFTRDIKLLKPVVSTWYNGDLPGSKMTAGKPTVILYPYDYLPVKNETQQHLIDAFVADLAKSLDATIRKVSIASLWQETRPPEASDESIQDYLKDAYVNTNFYSYYHHSTSDFRKIYQEKHNKRPYVTPFINWKWTLGEPVTPQQHEEELHRLQVYKSWFLEHAMKASTTETFLIMPISEVSVNYRDVPPHPVARPNGFDPLILSPILGAPDIVIPIGEHEYHSGISGQKEYLPVAVDVVGLPGSDYRLIEIVQQCLEMSRRPTAVRTGTRIFSISL